MVVSLQPGSKTPAQGVSQKYSGGGARKVGGGGA